MFKRLYFLCLLLIVSSVSFPQVIDSLLAVQRKADPQEKIYVQFDKNYYNPGETIWFKAYLFAGIDPSETSKNFYAELLDEQGTLISQKTAPIVFSGANGSFDIDSAFARPTLYFRAYTISMLNSDTNFLFNKAIRILSQKTTATKSMASSALPTLSFLPEGGDWVTGLASTMAFIATNEQGLPATVSGIIIDNTKTKVADLNTLHNGMGRVSIIPQERKTYSAIWKDAAGKQYITPLPSARSQGVVLKITDEETGKRFTVYRSEPAPDEVKRLNVIGYMNQQVVFKASLNLSNKVSATGIFPTINLPSGILQILKRLVISLL